MCGAGATFAACGGDSGGTGSETTSSSTTGTSTESSTSTDPTDASQTTSTTETGSSTPPCPFYAYEVPTPGNVDSPYEFIPDPTDEPDFWVVEYTARVPGLSFGPMISGVPEEEGRFEIAVVLAGPDDGRCQPESRTLVIGPPLPGDSSGSDSSGSDSDSSSTDSSGSGTDSGTSSTGA